MQQMTSMPVVDGTAEICGRIGSLSGHVPWKTSPRGCTEIGLPPPPRRDGVLAFMVAIASEIRSREDAVRDDAR